MRHALTLSLLAAACALSACKEPQQPADFTPEPGQAATTVAPAAAAPSANAPIELTYDQRRLPLVAGLRCNLERVNGAMFAGTPVPVSKSGSVRLSGWLADVDAKRVPAAFDLRLVNTENQRVWKLPTRPAGARQDVQALLGGDAAFAAPGYASEFSVGALPEGTYRVYAVLEEGGKGLACDNGRSVVVGP